MPDNGENRTLSIHFLFSFFEWIFEITFALEQCMALETTAEALQVIRDLTGRNGDRDTSHRDLQFRSLLQFGSNSSVPLSSNLCTGPVIIFFSPMISRRYSLVSSISSTPECGQRYTFFAKLRRIILTVSASVYCLSIDLRSLPKYFRYRQRGKTKEGKTTHKKTARLLYYLFTTAMAGSPRVKPLLLRRDTWSEIDSPRTKDGQEMHLSTLLCSQASTGDLAGTLKVLFSLTCVW